MLDHFEILGVPARFELDLSALEQRYKTLSRQWHPDRWARGTSEERRRALSMTTALNDAYRTLRDPVRRAEYLLERRGLHPVGEEQKNVLPMEFLEEVMEARERLMEAQMEGDVQRVAAETAMMRARREKALTEIALGFEHGRPLEEIGRRLAELRYYDRFLEDVERA